MEPHHSDDNSAAPPPPPPPPPGPPHSPPLLAYPPQPWTSTSPPRSHEAEHPPESPPLPAYPPQPWILTYQQMSHAEMPPQLPPLLAHSPQPWVSTSPPMSQAEIPPQYYYSQPMVMPPPLHYQPAPWVPPPGQYNADPGMYGPGFPAYEYNYPGYLRTWNTDLCDCSSDMRNCFVTAVCPCVTFGQISEIINEGQTSCWEGCMLYAIVSLFLGAGTAGLLTGIFGGWYRNKLREKYKLRGTIFNDFLVHALCEPCALCQEYRELGRFGFEVPLGWKENMEMQKAATAVYQVAPVIQQGMMR
ncbi:Cell number regulator like [Heracleum sosnowskyi]|uniref:Cell number regulator like n=1 Tax=Heracleum sosnowskyi TaxID=360622 RepID=A0AAD8I153_9APIA|nr:Cell number regulator like [Heracleum sosnowskyi]